MRNYIENIDDILKAIDAGEELSEKVLQDLAYYQSIEDTYGENRRWSRWVRSIIDLNGRYFAIEWDEGLTEMQPDEFYEQPYEVELKEYDKVVHVKEWIKKNEN